MLINDINNKYQQFLNEYRPTTEYKKKQKKKTKKLTIKYKV